MCGLHIDDVCGMAGYRRKVIRNALIRNAQLAIDLLHKLGFGIHPEKVPVDP